MTSVRFNSNSALRNQSGDCIEGLTQGIRPLSDKPEITEHYISAPITFGLSSAYICTYAHACKRSNTTPRELRRLFRLCHVQILVDP